MAKVQNKDLLNSMRETMSQEYQGRVGRVADGTVFNVKQNGRGGYEFIGGRDK